MAAEKFIRQRFLESYNALIEFKKKSGRWPKQHAVNKVERRLAVWCNNKKTAFKNNRLPAFQIKNLKKINFPLESRKSNWEESYLELTNYIKTEKCFPKSSHILYKFFTQQKYRYHRLDEQRKKLIDKIIASRYFKQNGKFLDSWNDNFRKVVDYIKEHNTLPSRKTNKQLTYWLNANRERIKNKKLPKEKIELLKSTGIAVSGRSGLKWEKNFDQLTVFVNKHKRMPARTEPGEKQLYSWLINQRSAIKNRKLSKERMRKLSSLRFE
jgi:hypothetical protein